VFDTTLTKPIDNLSARAIPTPRLLASPFGLCTASCREAANHEEPNTGSAEDKLGLPDLDHAKAAVLASLGSPESQCSHRHAIDEFVEWYCSEPRLSSNNTVATRYWIHLEDRRLAPGTTNARLAAVRRLAAEAADTGLLSPELAAGIRRVKGSKRFGVRLGNWFTAEQARSQVSSWARIGEHSGKGCVQ